jgi:glycosyltransferase involved in cell wall biosynthesis
MTVGDPRIASGARPVDESVSALPRVAVALDDGFYGASSGSAFSNRAFLTAVGRLLPPGRLVVIPSQVPGHRRSDPLWTAEVQETLQAQRAAVLPVPGSRVSPGSVSAHETLCEQVGEQVAKLAAQGGRCLLVGLDLPFLGLAPHLPDGVELILVPRSTTALVHPEDDRRIRWERAGLLTAVARGHRVAAISQHMRRHFSDDYGVPAGALLDLPNGLLLDEDAEPPSSMLPLPPRATAGFLLAMGRAVPEKGFEDLLLAVSLLREQGVRVPHLVLAATSAAGRPNAYQALLKEGIRAAGIDATLVTVFTPAVRGWLYSAALRAVVVPSREEAFGRIPLEAFAAKAAPVVATRAGGLAQTVMDGVTGVTARPGDARDLASAIRRALEVTPRQRARFVKAGSALLTSRHDYRATIRTALADCAPWALAPAGHEAGEPR